MRILFDPAVYNMRNKGNNALLQIALRRVGALWPEASLEVMTESPHLLRLYCPEAFPVSTWRGNDWSQNREAFERLHRLVPGWVFRALIEAREELEYRGLAPAQVKRHVKARFGRPAGALGEQVQKMEALEPAEVDPPDLQQAMEGADVVIGTGGGYLVDSDRSAAHPVLLRLARAKEMGKFTALVGQGVGRIEAPEFRALARTVLPEIDLILVRETGFAVPLLESLGTPSDRIQMSGDDAVELAYEARETSPGRDLGVSVRLAHYTDVQYRDLDRIRPILHAAATRHHARLIAVPTSCSGSESDQFQIRALLAGYPKSAVSWRRFESIPDLIKKIGRCRVVVAGAFHAAVFALSQGIPAIGLTRTKEYEIKLGALVEQFGPGCQLLYLDDERLPQKLGEAIDRAWASADDLRPQLLAAASEQIRLGQEAYRRLYDLYELHRGAKQVEQKR